MPRNFSPIKVTLAWTANPSPRPLTSRLPVMSLPPRSPTPQFHDGIGFLVSHSLLTNTFEFSLQLVNPKLTVPYWDFTMETTAASKVQYDPAFPLTRTEMLSPWWFGSVDLNDHVVRGLFLAFLCGILLEMVGVVEGWCCCRCAVCCCIVCVSV